jgi:serine protease
MWAADQGAKVINLSVTGGGYVQSTNEQFNHLYHDRGVLVVGASGNNGNGNNYAYEYPASYSAVISVAAVYESMERAFFSQANDLVDLAAPGYQVLSTATTGMGHTVATLDAGDVAFTGKWMKGSPDINGNLQGPIVYCDNYGFDPCPGPGGHICLVKNSGISEAEKAINCQSNGGVAIIVFRGQPGSIDVEMLPGNSGVNIPVALFNRQDGVTLSNDMDYRQVTLTSSDGYTYSDGTSFAAPHVAGAAAAIWRNCIQCSNKDVESCLYETALDLGEQGRDPEYGHGFLQMKDAFKCLRRKGCC